MSKLLFHNNKNVCCVDHNEAVALEKMTHGHVRRQSTPREGNSQAVDAVSF